MTEERSTVRMPDERFAELAFARQCELIKPRGALGRLEELACWFAARQARVIPAPLSAAVTVFAADHGVAEHNVSAYPATVTQRMVQALGEGLAAINVLTRIHSIPLTIVDVGVSRPTHLDSIHDERIAAGTHDLLHRAAMNEEQMQCALQVGAKYARRAIDRGCTLLIAGEIGIANTTSAACITAATTGSDATEVVGFGTGISAQAHARKISIVSNALARVGATTDPLTILRELGGLEIAAMTGYFLEGARSGIPCLLDGFISTAAALVATRISAASRRWFLASHCSAERGHSRALQHLDLHPLLTLDMRLGEGTGAVLALPIIQSALHLHAQMATFAEAAVPGTSEA